MKDVNQELEGPEEFDGYPEDSLDIRAESPNENTETDSANYFVQSPFGPPRKQGETPMKTNLGIWDETPYPQEIEAYWKSKEGLCLGCKAEIAIEDQYCPACESYLLEMYAQQEANHLRIEMES